MGAQWKAKGKAAAADARGKLFGRLAKDIMVAARSGADPALNARLRLVIEQARKASMPKDTLDRAIKELPLALDIYFLPKKRMPAKGMLALANLFGKRMRSLPDKNGLRFALNDRYKKKITNFVTRLLMIASGDEEALTARAKEQAEKLQNAKSSSTRKGKERE